MTPSGLTHGADTDRLEDIATQLLASAQRVGAVGDTGTASAPVLEEAWAGGDCEAFIGSWQSARQMVEQTQTHLRAFAALLQEQAAQQDAASGGGAAAVHPSPSSAPTGPGPDGAGGSAKSPASTTAMVSGLPRSLLREFWDSPIGEGYRAQHRAWSASDMTYFERLFVPWAAPPEWRDKYLKVVDGSTDWANDAYLWARRNGTQGDELSISVLKGVSDWASGTAEDIPPNALTAGWKFGLGAAGEELDSAARLIENPKQWWDDAGSLDQAGVAVSLIPGAGVVGKAGTKSAKEVIDLLTSAGKHGDEVAKHADDVGKHGEQPKPASPDEDAPQGPSKPDGDSSKDGSAVPTPRDQGEWQTVNESMKERAAAYQEQITGRPATDAYVVGKPGEQVKFDGYGEAGFAEAKGSGYSQFIDKDSGEFKPWYRGRQDALDQATRQINAANGEPITWYVAEADAAKTFRNLFAKNGIDQIDVVHRPASKE